MSIKNRKSWRETKVVFKFVNGTYIGLEDVGWRETKVVFK